MNISKAEQFVNEAINRFAKVIEIPFAIPVYICARQEVDEERTKLMRSLGAELYLLLSCVTKLRMRAAEMVSI